MEFNLFRVERIPDNKKRFRYKFFGHTLECCQKIFALDGFKINKITILINDENMKPKISKNIKTFAECIDIYTHNNISQIIFKGKYQEKFISIYIDADLAIMNIVSEQPVEELIAQIA